MMAAFILTKKEFMEYKKIARTKINIYGLLEEVSLRQEIFLAAINKKYGTENEKGLSINSNGEVEIIS